jgi:preprotein translocase SecE subunit
MKQNVFVRIWKKICKFTTDTVGELKKVVWTPKAELAKSTKLVIVTVLAVAIAIALVDLGASWALGRLAGLIG